MRLLIIVVMLGLMTGCSSGAVVFAPTPLPPDLSPLVYTHPSGVFSVAVPRNWSVYEQNTTIVASAAFSAPAENEPAVRFAVLNTGDSVDSSELATIMDQYQKQLRPDAVSYTEVNRQAMGDGSWRLTGLRTTVGGLTQQLNTFVQQLDGYLGIAEVIVDSDSARTAQLQQIVNTFTLNTQALLEPAEPAALAYATTSDLDFLHVATWSTPNGVFFITGEVSNRGAILLTDIPVRAVLQTADGVPVAEAVDVVMGYGLPPGGFAPFSLRFGQGQSALTTQYELSIGGDDWLPETDRLIYGQDELMWDDESNFLPEGSMVIEGSVTNIGTKPVTAPRAVVTVFDSGGSVIAAGFTDLSVALNPGDSADYRLVIPDLGGQPVNYITMLQGLP
ncbi:MAG: hypothetical protein J0L63_00710 [Anaerolineae bacterium]|nr:hypothetical protein [Anaerolineae bacterium]MBN8617391.1 hypothetical protein [Anaerolineae bacterium]